MALSVFMHGSRKLPVLSNSVSKLLCTQYNNSQLVFTPIIARKFSAINNSSLNLKRKENNQLIQARMISHSAIWTAEKLVSVGLLGIIPACLAIQNPITDNVLALAVVLHMHWGVEAVVVDYIRPSLVGQAVASLSKALVYLLSAFTLGGLLYFNYNDMGISKAMHRLWAIKPHEK